MLSKDKILRETSPLSIFFVKSGSGGNRLLFRFPYNEQFQNDPAFGVFCNEQPLSEADRSLLRNVINEKDEALCNMFSVRPHLCGQKFEIKINSVRHVGHPMSLLPQKPPTSSVSINSTRSINPHRLANQPQHHIQNNHHCHSIDPSSSSLNCLVASNCSSLVNHGDITSFNIVCALKSTASYDIVDCYHDLCRRLSIALEFEERRCSYLCREIKTILATLDEMDMADLRTQDSPHSQPLDAGESNQSGLKISDNQNLNSGFNGSIESNYGVILNRSNLARDLKRIFISLSTSGIVDLKINNWVNVSFCLPQRVHRLKLMMHKSMPAIGNRDIKRCLKYLRPYHGLLLLCEPQELLDSLPIDASPALIQLIKITKPDKNFMDLSVDANLTLMQIFCLVAQLIYWAKGTIIYPICDSNTYAIHPLASTGTKSKLVNDFRIRFPTSKSLHHYLSDFSEGTSLSQLNGPLLNMEEKLNLLSIVTWLLQRRVLIQVHKYILLVVENDDNEKVKSSPIKGAANRSSAQNDSNQHSSPSIEVNPSNNNISPYYRSEALKASLIASNSIDSSPRMLKNSFSESFDSSMRRYRTDSLPESQDESNFGLNSSLSSTPNSNLDYPSPSNDPNNRSSLSSSCPLDNPASFGGTDTILTVLQKVGLSQSAAKSILSIPSSKNPDDLKLFMRLIPYFDGRHHIEDIMFFENLERSQVLILCDKFRNILFCCHYEDVAVSQLCPFDSSR